MVRHLFYGKFGLKVISYQKLFLKKASSTLVGEAKLVYKYKLFIYITLS